MKHHDEAHKQTPPPAVGLREKLRGILIPFPTPFDSEGGVDARAVRSNILRWNETGVAGYVALGSTGERVHLDAGEQLAVVEAAREAVPARLAFVVGTGAHSTRLAAEESRTAARAGADAVLVLTPHFYRASLVQEALFRHFAEVADSSPVPVVLYNIPQNTGVALAPETVARLSEHENIAGIKDSSGDMVNFVEMLRLTRGARSFAVTTGHAGVLYAALASGAHGATLAAACVASELCVEIYRGVEAGEHARASELQARLAPIARAVTLRYGIGGLKAALDALGLRGGPPRAPLKGPDADARREIERLLEEATRATEEAEPRVGAGGRGRRQRDD